MGGSDVVEVSSPSEWAAHETARRATLAVADRCPTMLLSYPRSGNHR